MASFTLYPIPVGSQLTSTLGADDDADTNDFEVLIVADENVSGLTLSGLSVSAGSIVDLMGSNSVWIATVRPPETADAALAFTIAADSVDQGNVETSKDIRVSRAFPDADAEVPTVAFSVNVGSVVEGLAVTSTRILISTHDTRILFYTHPGVAQTSEEMDVASNIYGRMTAFNDGFLVKIVGSNIRRFAFGNNTQIAALSGSAQGESVVATRLGILSDKNNADYEYLPYGKTFNADVVDIDSVGINFDMLVHQSDLLYSAWKNASGYFALVRITEDDTIEAVRVRLNIDTNTSDLSELQDIAIYGDTLYSVESAGSSIYDIATLDIRPYRPLSKNTKALIHPVFANEGDTLDLTQYAPDAETITFDVGFDLPSYLSIANNTLTVSGTFTQATPCFVKLKGINRIDATETGSFGFYLIILPSTASVWNSVDELAMQANSTYNLHQLVVADSIAFRAGKAKPTGSTLSDGVFTIGTVGGSVEFTATHNGLESHTALQIDVIQTPANLKGARFRYKVEIEGIDVSPDLLNAPQVSESLDPVAINETRINEATVTLKNYNKYDINRAGNFWTANTLNSGGFQNTIKVYTEHLISGTWAENLLFSGVIGESFIKKTRTNVFFQMNCVDASRLLQNIVPQTFGRLTKWAETRKTTEEATYQGVYAPETALLPIQPQSGKAWVDRTALTLSMLENASEGSVPANTGYLTEQEFRNAGGFTEVNPVLNYNTAPRGTDLEAILRLLAAGETHAYNIEIDITGKTLDTAYSLNRGNVAHHVQATRNTVLMTGWVHDDTANRILMLLSNPEQHLQDLIVEYSLTYNTYRTLHTLPKTIKAHRIERRNSTNYYLLTSGNITQDRSDTDLPRQSDKTAYAYDSLAEGSDVQIYTYNTNTGVLTAHVQNTSTYPPQLGIHYHVGFENAIYIDEFEGIVADYRGSFKWQGSYLYYRYAKDGEFGIARVNTSGTVTGLIDQTTLNYHNWLNFAFDLTSGGDIYFVYSVGGISESSLIIKRRTSAGVESTILTDTQDLDALTALDAGGGAYLGCHEALFHDDALYMLCPIQRVDADDASPPVYTRSREKAAGMVLFSCNVTAGTPSLTVIEKWDFATHGGCNLVVHDGAIHYTEQPSAATRFKPINPSL